MNRLNLRGRGTARKNKSPMKGGAHGRKETQGKNRVWMESVAAHKNSQEVYPYNGKRKNRQKKEKALMPMRRRKKGRGDSNISVVGFKGVMVPPQRSVCTRHK